MIVEQSIVLAGKANRSKAFAPIILKEKKKILPKPDAQQNTLQIWCFTWWGLISDF